MAGKRIQGITIEIGGETTKLQSALKVVDGQLSKTQSSLNDVNRLLKLDPTNTELLSQKQKLLESAVKDTTERLKVLRDASEKAAATAGNYDAWKVAYDPIQKEIDETKEKLKELKQRQAEMKSAGSVDTEAYKQLQAEIKETNSRMKELKESQEKVNEEFGNPISPEKFDSLQREIAETEIKLSGLKSEIKQLDDTNGIQGLSDDLKGVKTAAGEAGDGLGKIADATTVSALADTAEILGEVSEKLQEVGEAAYETYAEIEGATTKVSGYFGETGEAAQKSAKVIKDVYESGLGESMDSVADAVISVKKQLGELSDTELNNITQQAIILDETFGVDMNESLRGANALMKHFGMDAQTAMDYIVTGTQKGLDKTNELGDNLAEYSGKFAEAGYSAEEYFQLLNNGLDGGAYNLDKVNDAINEVTTRLGDGTIAESIGQYSTKTQELFKAWQSGKATQKDVIDSIVADINNAKGQQEQWNLATTAFGTMAEDGGMKMVSSLTSIGNAYTDVSGKATAMNEATTTPMQTLAANMRKLHDALAPIGEKMAEIGNAIIPPLVEGISFLSELFRNLPGPIQTIITSLGMAITAVSAALPVIAAVKAAIMGIKALGIGASIASLASPIGIAIAAITAIISIGTLLYQNWDVVKEKVTGLWSKIKEVWAGIKTTISEAVQNVVTTVTTKFEEIKTTISEKITAAKDTLQNIWNTICNVVQVAIMFVKEIISAGLQLILLPWTTIWVNIKDYVLPIWENIKTTISNGINSAKETITNVMNVIKTTFSTIWNNVKTVVTTVMDGIKTSISEKWNNIKTTITTVMNTVKTGISTVWDGIKSKITSAVNSIRSTVSSIFNAVKTAIETPLNAAKSTVSGILDSIKTSFSSKMNAAKSAVSDAISAIRNKFKFSWSLPNLKLPHPEITGKFSLNPPSVPKFSISWYQKAMDKVHILNGASIFGAMNGSLLGGGETGSEMVVGTQHMMNLIHQATTQSNMAIVAALNNMANRLINVMTEYFPRFANQQIIMDTGAVVGALAPEMDMQLGRIADHKGRGI